MPIAKIWIRGLTSAEDEGRVEEALSREPGVFGAIANRTSGCGEVDYEDDEVSVERLMQIVTETGFEAELAG
jgi:copper chaperone CopZ